MNQDVLESPAQSAPRERRLAVPLNGVGPGAAELHARDEMIRGMAALADAIPGGQLVAIDSDLAIVGCSRRWAEAYGFQAASLAGRPLRGFEQSPYAEERRAIARGVFETRAATVVRSIRHGMHEVAVMLPVEVGGRCLAVVWFTQPGTGCAISTESSRMIYPTHHQWGAIGQATNRQLDVLRLLGSSFDNSTIAQLLNNGKRTVEWHVSVLMEVLGARDRAELVRLSTCAGLPFFPAEAWSKMLRSRERGAAARARSAEPPRGC